MEGVINNTKKPTLSDYIDNAHIITEIKKDLDKEDLNSTFINSLFTNDNSSFSDISFLKQRKIFFNLELHIKERLLLKGEVILEFILQDTSSKTRLLILDSNKLDIESVEISFNIGNSDKSGIPVISDIEKFVLDKCENINFEYLNNKLFGKNKDNNDSIDYNVKDFFIYENKTYKSLGNPLLIEFNEKHIEDILIQQKFYLKIKYNSKGNSTYNHVISPSMAFSESYFAFVDHEAIGARSSFPCQDTPAAKMTSYFELTSINPLIPLASGRKIKSCFIEKDNTTINKYFYYNKIPVSTYLIVFACAEVMEKQISKRCKLIGVEEDVLNAEKVYTNLEEIIEKAESIIDIKYEWEEFNILIIPNYAFEGMENPYLTYISRHRLHSISLVPHELMHSWTGNLITNKHWECFWVNEGITTYLEHKMIRELLGELEYKCTYQYSVNSLDSLMYHYKDINKPFLSCLNMKYNHADPTDHWGTLPYIKGAMLLHCLEDLITEKNVLKLIKNLVLTYKYECLDSSDVINFFSKEIREIYKENENKAENVLLEMNFDKWLNEPYYYRYDKNRVNLNE